MRDRSLDEDVAEGVEWAERGPDFQRLVGEVVGTRGRLDPAAVDVAEEDTYIERKDLGPESATFVGAGSPIPAELRELPRRAARPAPRKK
jgi:hypothetical protein